MAQIPRSSSSNHNSSSSSMSRWSSTSISFTLAVLTVVLNNHQLLQPYYKAAAKRLYEYCQYAVHKWFLNNDYNNHSNNSSSSSNNTINNNDATTNGSGTRPPICAPPCPTASSSDSNANAVLSSTSKCPSSFSVEPHFPVTKEDLRIIKHEGSCQCAAISFYIVAPRLLPVQEGSGKVKYPRTCVKAKHFTMLQGHEALQTYRIGSSRAALTFCRQCGAHLLYVPNESSKVLYLNVDCLQPGWKRRNIPTASISIDAEEDEEDNMTVYHKFYDYLIKPPPPPPVQPLDNRTGYYNNRSSSNNNNNLYMHHPNPYRQPHCGALDIVTEDESSNQKPSATTTNPPLVQPPRERTFKSTHATRKTQNSNHFLPMSSAVAAVARETHLPIFPQSKKHHYTHQRNNIFSSANYQPEPAASTATAEHCLYDDDISEPTIPPDLISMNGDAVSVGECSVRSHLTEATAKSLRRFMSKHLRNHHNNNNTSSATAAFSSSVNSATATTAASSSFYTHGTTEEEEEEDQHPPLPPSPHYSPPPQGDSSSPLESSYDLQEEEFEDAVVDSNDEDNFHHDNDDDVYPTMTSSYYQFYNSGNSASNFF